MNEELQELLSHPTVSVQDAGRVCFGMSANASYRAARSGRIPTIQVGGTERPRFLVPTAMLKKMLGIEAA
jgi:hypothetical protein